LDSRLLRCVAASPGEWFPAFEGCATYILIVSCGTGTVDSLDVSKSIDAASYARRPVINDIGVKLRSSSSKF